MSGGTPDTDLARWLQERFDRLDDKVDRRTADLQEEVQATRHGLKPVIEQLAIQIAETVVKHAETSRRVDAINTWRSDDGPLDQRFHRHSERIDKGEAWRNRFAGGLAVLMFLFPTTVGVVVALLR